LLTFTDLKNVFRATEDEVDTILASLDGAYGESEPSTIGPFGVFRALIKPAAVPTELDRPVQPKDAPHIPLRDNQESATPQLLTRAQRVGSPLIADESTLDIDDYTRGYSPPQSDTNGNIDAEYDTYGPSCFQNDSASDTESHGSLQALINTRSIVRIHELGPDDQFECVDASDWRSDSALAVVMNNIIPPASAVILPSLRYELSLPNFRNQDSAMLMHHYTTHVADILQPILHPSNPWKTTYVPIALEGSSDILVARNPSYTSHATVALYHSLLASAAFHLRDSTQPSSGFHDLGVKHKAKSLKALHEALNRPNDPRQYKVYMAAMLSLVTADVSKCPL
jgi:Fungal specific transcription factor domain